MKTPIAIDSITGEIRLISDISKEDKDLKCNCICPACKAPLVARKGPQRADHFSHHRVKPTINCGETAIHLMAKHILQNSEYISLPSRSIHSAIKYT